MAETAYLGLAPFGRALASKLGASTLARVPDPVGAWLRQTLSEAVADENAFLNRLEAASLRMTPRLTGFSMAGVVVGNEELSIGWEGLPVQLLFAPGADADSFEFGFAIDVDFSDGRLALTLDLAIGLRFDPGLLSLTDSAGQRTGQPVTIRLAGRVFVNEALEIDVMPVDTIELPECMIGDTGLIVSARGIEPDVSGGSFRFGEMVLKLPRDFEFPVLRELRIRNATLGRDGFSGDVGAAWELTFDPNRADEPTAGLVGDAVGTLFGAFTFGMRRLAITLEQNRPTRFEIEGLIAIPALDGAPLEAKVGLSAEGGLTVGLQGVGPDGIVKLTKENLFELQVNAAEFKRTPEEVALTVAGDFQLTQPTVKEILPKVQLAGLTVYRPAGGSWGLRIEGGAVEINKSIDLFGVARADIREIGLGRRGDTDVLMLSAGVQLFEGVDAAAWVDGLRIPLSTDNPDLALDGLGLRVVVPDTFEFTGAAVRKQEGTLSYFEGLIDLTIVPVELGIAASFRIGRGDCRFAFLAARVQFPAPGVQLGPLPLYLRGVNGLIGVNMTPDADAIHQFFPLATRQPVGLAHVDKWRVACGHHAIGLGAEVATANARLLNLAAMLAFVHPELLLLIEGRAFVLQEPAPGKEPPFHALMVLDLDEPAALLNIGAKYEFVKGILTANGTVESYHGPDPGNPRRQTSYFALGQVKPYFPADRPVNATVLKLFKAQSYFIVKPGLWALGASIGLPKKKIGFSAASVRFQAHMKGAGELFWGPEQFKGHLSLKGSVAFRILGKGFDLGLSARVLGMTPDWLVDALLKFGVRFKIAWKKIKFEGKIPFRWKKRVTPRVGEVLAEVRLQHAVTAETWPAFLPDPASDPVRANVPEVEPDIVPVLAFRYPINDRTGFPFGQSVAGTILHRSGDYTFEAALPGGQPGERGIELRRMKLGDFESGASWDPAQQKAERFEAALATPGTPVLYGAWQADQAPDGTEGATHLHLFARTPFEYSRATRLTVVKTAQVFDAMQTTALATTLTTAPRGAPESEAAVAAVAQAGLSADAPAAVPVPAVQDRLKPLDDLARSGRALPLRGLQIAVHEDSGYPWSGPADRATHCRNFLHSRTGFRAHTDPIGIGNLAGLDASSPETGRTDTLVGAIGAFASSSGSTSRGIGEVVRDRTLPYPLAFVRLYTDRGFDATSKTVVPGKVQPNGAFFKVSVRYPVRTLTIHYEGVWVQQLATGRYELPALGFLLASRRTFESEFWTYGSAITPAPLVDSTRPGVLVLTKAPGGKAFTDLFFRVLAPVRIFSICYELEPGGSAAGDPTHPLRTFVDVTWPYQPGDGLTPRSGPIPLDHGDMATPDGPVRPGYAYRLDVRTTHTRNGGAQRPDAYTAYFKVTKPPSNLAPYVLTGFPRDTGFPHYRAHELYVRFNRNYVHALCGADATEHAKLAWRILKDGESIVELPFRDGADADLSTFLEDTSAGRKGWGWGKAPNHELRREEKVWLEAYNRSAPAGLEIAADMAIPDDMIWVYPVNPALLRATFASLTPADGAGPAFAGPIVRGGTPVTGRWSVGDGFLRHRPDAGSATVPAPEGATDSMVLTRATGPGRDGTFPVPYRLSVWLRPESSPSGGQKGRAGLVVAAEPDGARLLLAEVDLVASVVRLVRYDRTRDPATVTWRGRPFVLPAGQWTKLVARVTASGQQLTVTVEAAGEVVLSEASDLSGALAPGRVGLMASADYSGWFDAVEVISLARLEELPRPSASHHLAFYYGVGVDRVQRVPISSGSGQATQVTVRDSLEPVEIYRREFFTSRYLDLFDHLNDWDRTVRRTEGAGAPQSGPLPAVDGWIAANARLLQALADVEAAESMYVQKGATLQDVDGARRRLREARFDLDEAFQAVAAAVKVELPIRPERVEVTLSGDARGLLIVSPEPIDWTRLGAGPIRPSAATAGPNASSGTEAASPSQTTKLVYSSDLTQAILLRADGAPVGSSTFRPFNAGMTYLWDVREYQALPPHLSWLAGWVSHRARVNTLALEIPGGAV